MSDLPDSLNADLSQPISVKRALEILSRGTIQNEHGLLAWGSNYAYLAPVVDGEVTLLAVYKPQRGERPLWDFPDGSLCYREVAAFVVSEILNWQIVPPTVLRSGPYGLGSVQVFIQHDPDMNYFSPFPPACREQLQRIAAFDYIINNADRKGGHCLLDSQGHLWGIDHGVTFHYAPKLRTVIWDFAGQALPEAMLQDLRALCDVLGKASAAAVQALQGLISEREYTAFRARVERLIEAGRFPRPGPGPNYPWPPV